MAGRSDGEQVRFLRESAGPGAATTRTTPFSGAVLGRLGRRFTDENGRSAGRPKSSGNLPVVMKSGVVQDKQKPLLSTVVTSRAVSDSESLTTMGGLLRRSLGPEYGRDTPPSETRSVGCGEERRDIAAVAQEPGLVTPHEANVAEKRGLRRLLMTPFQDGDRLGCGEEGSRLGPAVVET